MTMSENPMIAFSGVRSSWLIMARNSDFARLALSAWSLVRSNSASAALRSVMSKTTPSRNIGRPSSPRMPRPRSCTQRTLPSLRRMRYSTTKESPRAAPGEHDRVALRPILGIDQVAEAGRPALAELGGGVAGDLRHGVAHEDGGPVRVELAAVDGAGDAAGQRAKLAVAGARAVDARGEGGLGRQ